MGECKAKAIQTNLSTFKHNQTYPGIIQAYSGIFRTPCYSKNVIFGVPGQNISRAIGPSSLTNVLISGAIFKDFCFKCGRFISSSKFIAMVIKLISVN